MNWLTNDPWAARQLRAADRAWQKVRLAAQYLPLAEKVAAYKAAQIAREAAYAAVHERAAS